MKIQDTTQVKTSFSATVAGVEISNQQVYENVVAVLENFDENPAFENLDDESINAFAQAWAEIIESDFHQLDRNDFYKQATDYINATYYDVDYDDDVNSCVRTLSREIFNFDPYGIDPTGLPTAEHCLNGLREQNSLLEAKIIEIIILAYQSSNA